MKNIKIKYSQLLFLYAYLRFIDLSLDRSRWSLWNELKLYLENKITPDEVLTYLDENFQINKENNLHTFTSRGIIERIKCEINKIFKIYKLKDSELANYVYFLVGIDKFIHSDKQHYDLEVEQFRIQIAKFYTEVLQQMISNKDLIKLMKMEHFNQNINLDVTALIEFLPEDFIKI